MTGDRGDSLRDGGLVCAVAAFAAVLSYSHSYGLGRAHGQDGTAARLLPFVCGRASRPSRYSRRHRARPNMVPYIWFP